MFLHLFRTCSTRSVDTLEEKEARPSSKSWWGLLRSLSTRDISLTRNGSGGSDPACAVARELNGRGRMKGLVLRREPKSEMEIWDLEEKALNLMAIRDGVSVAEDGRRHFRSRAALGIPS